MLTPAKEKVARASNAPGVDGANTVGRDADDAETPERYSPAAGAVPPIAFEKTTAEMQHRHKQGFQLSP